MEISCYQGFEFNLLLMSILFEEHDLSIFPEEDVTKLLFESSLTADSLFPEKSEQERNEIIGNMIALYSESVRRELGEDASDVFAEETNQYGSTDTEKYCDYKNRRQISNPEDSAVLPIKGPRKASLNTADVNYYGELHT